LCFEKWRHIKNYLILSFKSLFALSEVEGFSGLSEGIRKQNHKQGESHEGGSKDGGKDGR